MRFWGRIAAVLVAVAPLIWFSPVHAQTSKNVTVTTCGTPPPGYSPSGAGYTAGGIYPQVMDINGNVCTNSLAAPASYALLTNASSTGPAVPVAGGNYGLDLEGTFGGSTVSIAYTLPNQSPVSLGSFTSATNSKTTCLVIPAGATVQATVTGGSPSGLYAQLGGVGSCASSGGGGGGSNAAASLTGAGVPLYASYTGLNFGGSLKGWVGDTNGYGDVNIMNVPAVSQSGAWSFTANAGTNLNTSLLALESGGNLASTAANTATTNTDIGPPGATACASDTGSCSLNAYFQRVAQRLTTINTTLGSPLQAGASIGNTSFGSTNFPTTVDTNVGAAGASTLRVAFASSSTAAVTQSTASSLNAQVVGATANNTAASGNPVAVSATAQNAETTAATNGQNATLATDLAHKLINSPYANKENDVAGTVTITASTTTTSLVAAPGAGLYIYITSISCYNSGASSTVVQFQNGSGGTVIYSMGAPAGGGFTQTFPVPIGGINTMTANTALFVVGLTSTSSLYCNAAGYKGS